MLKEFFKSKRSWYKALHLVRNIVSS
jgi:hypothetical protein